MLGISVLHAHLGRRRQRRRTTVFCPRLDAPATPERVLDAVDACARDGAA